MGEIERQFFETFEIKPKKQCYYWDCPYSTGEIEKDIPVNERDCANCTNPDKEVYPQITDRILLELICIANHESVYIDFEGTDVETLKNSLLGNFIYFKRIIPKRQVQALFEDV